MVGLVVDGRGCWVIVVVGRIEGYVWGAVVGESLVEDLLVGLSLVIT